MMVHLMEVATTSVLKFTTVTRVYTIANVMAFQVLLQLTSKPYSGMYHKQTDKNNKKRST